MKIVHVVTRLLQAGSEENTIATCLAQASAGHQVVLMHGNDWGPSVRQKCGDQVQVVEVPSLVHRIDLSNDLRAVFDMRARFLGMRPTVVHTHQSKAGILGRIAARLARVPLIIHGVHIVPFVNVGRVNRAVYLTAERLTARFTHAFINVSEGTKQSCLEHAVGRPDQHFVAHSGFDVARFEGASPPSNWRDLADVPEGCEKPPIVLMLAALEDRKRHVPLLNVFDRVIRRVPNVRLLLCGEGPARARIETVIREKSLSANVKLLGFQQNPERLIALSDITLLTSTREGLPRVVVQSLAGGRPAITSDLAGISEIVKHGINGLVTPSDDLGATADALADVLSDPHTLQRLRAGAAATDVSTWRVENMCLTIAGVYDKLAALDPLASSRVN